MIPNYSGSVVFFSSVVLVEDYVSRRPERVARCLASLEVVGTSSIEYVEGYDHDQFLLHVTGCVLPLKQNQVSKVEEAREVIVDVMSGTSLWSGFAEVVSGLEMSLLVKPLDLEYYDGSSSPFEYV